MNSTGIAWSTDIAGKFNNPSPKEPLDVGKLTISWLNFVNLCTHKQILTTLIYIGNDGLFETEVPVNNTGIACSTNIAGKFNNPSSEFIGWD